METAQKTEKTAEELSVEELFAELDGLIARLESADLALEESFSCYERGMRLVKACTARIDGVEKQIQVLREGSGDEFDA